MNLDANKVIDNLVLKVAQLTKQVSFLETENLSLKEELNNKSNQEG